MKKETFGEILFKWLTLLALCALIAFLKWESADNATPLAHTDSNQN